MINFQKMARLASVNTQLLFTAVLLSAPLAFGYAESVAAQEDRFGTDTAHFNTIISVGKCEYRPDKCGCCEWVDYVSKHHLSADETLIDFYFIGHPQTISEKDSFAAIILVPDDDVATATARALGCEDMSVFHMERCFNELRFRFLYLNKSDNKIRKLIEFETNGIAFTAEHNRHYTDKLDRFAFPYFCIEKQPSGSVIFVSTSEQIELVHKHARCSPYGLQRKARLFTRAYFERN